uniref:Uncharacterized protein n=1 Tax=Anopheles dirus TaxID=7168 RepID=A0A182NY43_9DIPT
MVILALLSFGILDWTIRSVTEWIWETSFVLCLLSIFPRIVNAMLIAALQGCLLCRILNCVHRALLTKLGLKEENIKLEVKQHEHQLSLHDITYHHANVVARIRSIRLYFSLETNPWISITVLKPHVTEAVPRVREQAPSPSDTILGRILGVIASIFMAIFLDFYNGGLLQWFLENIEFAIISGEYNIQLSRSTVAIGVLYDKICLGNRTNELCLDNVRIILRGNVWTSRPDTMFKMQSVNLLLKHTHEKRSKRYNNSVYNLLLGIQHWHVEGFIRDAEFIEDNNLLANRYDHANRSFYVKTIKVLCTLKDTAKLDIETYEPATLKNNFELRMFLEDILHLAKENSPAVDVDRGLQRSQTRNTFPRDTDLLIDVKLRKVSCLLRNSKNSCMLATWDQVQLLKRGMKTNVILSNVVLQVGDAKIDAEEVRIEYIKNCDDIDDYLKIYVTDPTATWDAAIHEYAKQMMLDIDQVQMELGLQGADSNKCRKRVRVYVEFNGRITFIMPDINSMKLKITATQIILDDSTLSVTLSNASICVNDVEIAYYKFLRLESDFHLTPFRTAGTLIYLLILNKFKPVRKWWNDLVTDLHNTKFPCPDPPIPPMCPLLVNTIDTRSLVHTIDTRPLVHTIETKPQLVDNTSSSGITTAISSFFKSFLSAITSPPKEDQHVQYN